MRGAITSRFPAFVAAAALAVIAVSALSPGTPARAQAPPAKSAPASTAAQADADVEQAMQNERDLVSVSEARPDCPDAVDNEIIVCARDHSARNRVQSSADENRLSPDALRTGALHPPDVGTHPPAGVAMRVGHVPPPIYYIDTTLLPSPAPGSDADKIAKGEMAAP